MSTTLACLWLAVTMVVGGAVAAPVGMDQLEEEHQLRMTFVTPHIEWGKPWYKGKTRVLMFCVGKYERARDAVELMERFDMDITTIYFRRNRKVIHFTTANVDREVSENPPESDGVQRARRLLRQKWDLFLFGNINPDVLPPELQYYMYKQVADGAGILCVGPKPEKVMTPEREMKDPPDLFPVRIPVGKLPGGAAMLAPKEKPENLLRRLVHAYKLGKGRGVHFALPGVMTVTPALSATPENLNELEYWFALAGHLGLWAAGKNMGHDELMELWQRDKKNLKALVKLQRLDGYEVLPWQVYKLRREGDDLVLDVQPQLPQDAPIAGGLVIAEGFLMYKNEKLRPFMDVADLTEAIPQRVTAVALHEDFCEPGTPIEGTVSLAAADYQGWTLRVETRDAWGRILQRKDLPLQAGATQVPFSLPTSKDCSIYMRLEASLRHPDGPITAPTVAEFRVPQRRRGPFHQVQWDAPNAAVGYWAELRLRQLGWDIMLGGVKSSIALADVPLIPYTTRLMEKHNEKGVMQPCCWNDPDKSQKWIESIAERQVVSRKHGVYCYSLGDETTTKGCCLSNFCLQTYRKYLQEQYGDIAALNKSWGTNYSSFDEVTLSKPDDNYEKTAFQQGNYARWFDRLAFSQWNYLQLNKRFGERYKKLDPQALTGFEGAGGFGDDIEAIVRTNGFYNPYPSVADEILRSVAPKGYIRGNWIGYQRDAEPLLYWYWRVIMNGCPCVFWWRWDGIGKWHGYIEPDFELYPATAEMQKDTEVVRQGLGDLLVAADRVDDGVAFFYSVAAAQADRLPDSKNYGGVRSAHEAWVRLTRGAGVGFRYVTNRQVEAGELQHGLKVLVLPFTRALSDKTVAEIRQFVEKGGTLIADLRPGDFTGHLARRQGCALDDLLGVKHEATGKPEQIDVTIDDTLAGQKLKLHVPKAHVERAVKVTSGTAVTKVGQTPLVVVRSVGKGRAILLNFAVADLAGLEPDGPQVRDFMQALYRACGVNPVATVESKDGKVMLTTGCWKAGELYVYGVQMRNYGYDKGRYTLRLARPMHIYDLRDVKYLGRKTAVSAPARRARFFVLSPQKLAPVRAAIRGTKLEPGDKVKLRLAPGAGNPKGLYGVSVRLYDPVGFEQLWARRALALSADTTLEMPLGLNAAGGQWLIEVRDLATGQVKKLPFTVAGDNPAIWPGCYVPKG
ncbi:MAG: beta-galactosidase [Armatimonadetes bacterium]|nr:beta-galactosidase [Armatimonadota bacterium]